MLDISIGILKSLVYRYSIVKQSRTARLGKATLIVSGQAYGSRPTATSRAARRTLSSATQKRMAVSPTSNYYWSNISTSVATVPSASHIAYIGAVDTLAPSARIVEYLIRRGRLPKPTMALTTVEPVVEKPEVFPDPPQTIITPCGNPWPRPYFLEDGLRRVAPYHFTYNTNVKMRWRGRGLLDIFADEFRDRTVEYYVRSVISTHKGQLSNR